MFVTYSYLTRAEANPIVETLTYSLLDLTMMVVRMLVRGFGLQQALPYSHVAVLGILTLLLPKLHEQGILSHDLSLPSHGDALEAKYMGLAYSRVSGKMRRIGERGSVSHPDALI